MFVIVYKEIRQLTKVDEFLEKLQNDFIDKEWPKIEIVNSVIMTALPLEEYGQRFDDIMLTLEKPK